MRYIRNINEREQLINQIELLKEKGITKMLTTHTDKTNLVLNMDKIETSVDGKLNDSDKKILNVLYNNPVLENKYIADKVALSYEGTSSSLQKMYRLFDLKDTKNKKLALIMKATHISNS